MKKKQLGRATGRFLSNVFDPYKPEAQGMHSYTFHTQDCGIKAMEAEWKQYMDWIKENVICPPKATKAYTQKQLIAMDMIGIYALA